MRPLMSVIVAGALCGVLQAHAPSAQSAAAVASAPAAVIPFDQGEPASLWWDAPSSTLFIADNEHNQVWSWTDQTGLRKLAATPDSTGSDRAASVGQIVRIPDGRLVIMRFGRPGGGIGGIVTLDPKTGEGREVPNLDPGRRRLGLAPMPDGTLFGSYFGNAPGGKGLTSSITKVDLTGAETDLAGGFVKIVGMVWADGVLYVADQLADTIYALGATGAAPLGERKIFAKLPRPDQLALGPDGSLFTGQFQAAPGSTDPLSVRQVLRDGTVKIVVTDPDVSRPSGVAYDAKGKRLFVANSGNPAQTFVRIVPIG